AQYCEVLSRAANLPVLITDRDHVVTCSGISRKDTVERRVSDEMEALMESRSIYIASANEKRIMTAIRGSDRKVAIAYPIIGGGDVSGAVVMLFGENEDQYPNPTDIKLAQVAATFLGKQTEE
ncbi:MAG: stage V sporulation protein T, partial [Clostridia bacterium]|nr:stage V sporulation protein T [Clostridia bacterium]